MGRTPCCEKDGLKKGPWTPEEDQKLMDYMQKHGHGNWRTLPKNAGLARCGKSCRLRWINYLRPDIKRGRFSAEEEETIIQLHRIYGNKWSAIAARLPGRTDNEIKNFWNTHMRKRLLKMGIDPVTHTLRSDLNLMISCLVPPSLYDSTQMELSRFLGLGPLINGELLKIVTTLLLSSQCQNSDNILSKLQNLQEQQYQTALVQDQFTSFQTLANIPPAIASNAQFLDEAQLTQAGAGELPTNQWQDNVLRDNVSENNFMPAASLTSYEDLKTAFAGLISEPSELFENNQKYHGPQSSFMSTPPSSSTALNSSPPTDMNSSNASARDLEIESYCSDLFDFEIPDLVDVSDDYV